MIFGIGISVTIDSPLALNTEQVSGLARSQPTGVKIACETLVQNIKSVAKQITATPVAKREATK